MFAIYLTKQYACLFNFPLDMCFIILQNTHGIITKMSWIFYNSKIYNNLEFKLTVFGL